MSMSKRTRSSESLKQLCLLALFIAIEMVMQLTGLSFIPVGPLHMSLLTIPVALGAMLLGPWQGCLLGTVFGACSLWQAITGASPMTGFFFSQVSAVHTIILCVVTRALMGLLTGLVFKAVRKIDKTNTICYFVGGVAAPLLNTLLFMGYIVLVFYNTAYIQEKVAALGALNPLMFVVLMVGVQGLLEAAAGLIIGGTAAKAVALAVKN